MGVYIGHFVNLPGDQFIAIADDFQHALDMADQVGQADESSVHDLRQPFRFFVQMKQWHDGLWLSHARPDPSMLKQPEGPTFAAPGTGPTGDTMRSYGPKCKKCGALHFKQQECRVFTEPAQISRITLFASKTRPGQGVIEVHQGEPLAGDMADFVEVGDLDELGMWGVLLFLYKDDKYAPDGENVHIESGQEQALDAYLATDAATLPIEADDEE